MHYFRKILYKSEILGFNMFNIGKKIRTILKDSPYFMYIFLFKIISNPLISVY
ncbi:hypothetical protein EMIT036CA2_10444 [Chryseobacterium sp. IT-36CA2]